MTDIRIIRERMPWWYELEWRPGARSAPGLAIHLRTKAVWTALNETETIASRLFPPEENFGEFIADDPWKFGYDGCFSWEPRDAESRSLILPIPIIEKEIKESCHLCNGTGKSFYDDELPCFNCKGRKKERILDWDSAYRISATLTVLFESINYLDDIPESSQSQLLTLETLTQKEAHGGSLHGTYSKTLVRWLSRVHPGTPVACMIQAMRDCYTAQFGAEESESRDFRASVDDKNGWLNVSCPGQACGLHPHTGYILPGDGYQWSSHNVDSPMQQLTLIAGLAALTTKARASGVR